MRYKDPKLMQQVLEFVESLFFEEGRSPSTAEIGRAVGVARGTVHRYLLEMNEKNIIQYNGKDIKTEKMEKVAPATSVRVFGGAIPCGPLEEIESSVEEYVKLPTTIFGTGDLYIIRTTGDSMIEAGISSGDLVVVERQNTAQVGDIVVALYDNANTLKRLGYDADRQQHMLIPENSSMEPIYTDHLAIQGVARFVIKAL